MSLIRSRRETSSEAEITLLKLPQPSFTLENDVSRTKENRVVENCRTSWNGRC